MLYEGVVLFCSSLGEWLEPVGVVCNAILVSPLLDAFGNSVSDRAVESSTVVDNVNEFLIDITWKYSEGRSTGAITSRGFFLKASATTSNLKFAIVV